MKGSLLRPPRGHEPLATPWAGHAYKANDVAADFKARGSLALFAPRCESMTRRTLRDCVARLHRRNSTVDLKRGQNYARGRMMAAVDAFR